MRMTTKSQPISIKQTIYNYSQLLYLVSMLTDWLQQRQLL